MRTVLLLIGSNLFRTYAWYGHLHTMQDKAWWVAALCLMGAVYFMFRAPVAA